MKKLFLTTLGLFRKKDTSINLGISSLCATLKKKNLPYHSKTYNMNDGNLNLGDISKNVMEYIYKLNIDSVGFGVYVWNVEETRSIVADLRNSGFSGDIIFGGPEVTYGSHEKLYNSGIDYVSRGYSEETIHNYVKFGNSKNLLPISEKGKIFQEEYVKRNSKKEEIENFCINDFGSPLLEAIVQPNTYCRWETKRGCSYSCSFCQHTGENKKVIEFDEERIEKEIDFFKENEKLREITLVDPIFNQGKRYLNILRLLNSKIVKNKRFSFQCRFEHMNDEFIEEIKGLKKKNNEILLEFGIQTIHLDELKAINRRNNIKKIEKMMGILFDSGIEFEVSIIYGLPNQTLESFKETIEWINVQGVESSKIKAFPLMLLSGSDLFYEKEKYGLMESNEKISHVISSDSFSLNDYEEMKNIANNLGV